MLTAANQLTLLRMLLIPAFVVLHVSYGAGMLIGFARFWNRWGERSGHQPSSSTI